MKILKKLIAAAALAILPAGAAVSEITIDITTGTQKPLPIAIPDFGGGDEISRQIAEVVRADLESTGLFSITDESAFIQKDLNINVQPRFADWKIIKTDALVVGESITLPDGRIQVAFRLWDVYGGEVMRIDGKAGRQFTAIKPLLNWCSLNRLLIIPQRSNTSPWHNWIAQPPPKGQVAGSTPAGDAISLLLLQPLPDCLNYPPCTHCNQ